MPAEESPVKDAISVRTQNKFFSSRLRPARIRGRSALKRGPPQRSPTKKQQVKCPQRSFGAGLVPITFQSCAIRHLSAAFFADVGALILAAPKGEIISLGCEPLSRRLKDA
jgi:hypothetical protein